MSESDEANTANDATTPSALATKPATPRKMAAIPSLRPAPRGRPSSRALAIGFSALAAVVILVVVAATLFASQSHAPAKSGPTAAQHASATATAQAKLAANAPGPIAAISMLSPTDGWAIGDATPQQQSGIVQAQAALYHYDGRQWTLKQRVDGYAAGLGSTTSLRMFSPTDGWAFGDGNSVLRYDGTTWRMESISLAGGAQINNLFASDIVSSTEGWAVAYFSPSSGGVAIGFLRFDGSQWTVEQTGIKLPSDFDPQSLNITHLAALPGGDVWAIGNANVNVTASAATATANVGNNPKSRGFLIHRAHGVWTVDEAVSLPANAVSSQFNDITMTSATSGWVVGQVTVNIQMVGGGPMAPVQQPLLLRYDGARWSVVQTPQMNGFTSDGLVGVVASGPDNVWALTQTSGYQINANGQSVSAILVHFDGANWTEVDGIFPGITYTDNAQLSSIVLGPDGTLWFMGATLKVKNQQGFSSPLITSYHDGAWSVATIVTK